MANGETLIQSHCTIKSLMMKLGMGLRLRVCWTDISVSNIDKKDIRKIKGLPNVKIFNFNHGIEECCNEDIPQFYFFQKLKRISRVLCK
jgi:hypothetical protein